MGALTASDTVSPDSPVRPEAAGRALAWGCAAGRGPGAAAAGSWGSSTARCACNAEGGCARQGRRMAARPGQSMAERGDRAALSREAAPATTSEKKRGMAMPCAAVSIEALSLAVAVYGLMRAAKKGSVKAAQGRLGRLRAGHSCKSQACRCDS